MVLDDEPDFVDLMCEFLSMSGYRTIGLTSVSGIQEIIDNAPDLLLLDVHMPGLSGKQVLSCMRQHQVTRGLPVILITGFRYALDSSTITMADEVIDKPVALDALLMAIEERLQ